MRMGRSYSMSNERDKPDVFRIIPPEFNDRHESIRKDIASRLRKSCSGLSEEGFAALVEKILKVQLRGEKRWH